jgi:raffinose/stachyose/melibiose transport system permease protein
MATYLLTQGTQRGNYGIAGAASVVLFVIGVVMAALYQRFVLRRDTRPEG